MNEFLRVNKRGFNQIKEFFCNSYNPLLFFYILFFTLKKWNDFYLFISFYNWLVVLIIIISISFIISWILQLFISKKSIAYFSSFVINFLIIHFNTYEDIFSLFFPNARGLYIKSAFIVILALVIIISVSVLKNVVITNTHLHRYILTVIVSFLIFEGYRLVENVSYNKLSNSIEHKKRQLSVVDRNYHPDIYVILLDEYSGQKTLESYGYSNNFLLSNLKELNFIISDSSKSNYQHTLMSVASLFNMNYLEEKQQKNLYKYLLEKIYFNTVIDTFRTLGYKIFNYSPFLMQSTESLILQSRFLPTSFRLILSETIYDDLIDFGPPFLMKAIGKKNVLAYYVKHRFKENQLILYKLKEIASKNSDYPKFIYAHLMMPHSPFLFKANGKINFEYILKKNTANDDKIHAYLEYLQFTNHKLIEVLRFIKNQTQGKAIIMVLSDHGSRDIANKIGKSFVFYNLNAVYCPKSEKINIPFFDSISLVNQFRFLLNRYFDKNLNMHTNLTLD